MRNSIKLTEEQERDIWENAPDGYDYVMIKSIQGYLVYLKVPILHVFSTTEVVKSDSFKDIPDETIYERPDKYCKNIDVSLGECCYRCDNYLGINIVNCGSEIICKEGHTEHPFDKCEFYSERNKAQQDCSHTIKGTWESDQYKPNYYLRAGEQYQPNRISDAYNLEGSKNQALKYLLRAGHKPIEGKSKVECEIVDLNKAKQQIIDRLEFLEGLE